jgi:hypothetical protein
MTPTRLSLLFMVGACTQAPPCTDTITCDTDTDTDPKVLPSEFPPLDQPVVAHGEEYFSSPDRFHRAYTDPSWTPDRTLYVSASGTHADPSSSSASSPSDVAATLAIVQPGDEVVFLNTDGDYAGCYELTEDQSGNYVQPILLRAEGDVRIDCCDEGRASCFNLEGADYIGIQGFELVGGDYGVRAVGLNVESTQHQIGVALLDNVGHDQWKDPFFTGQSDWCVIEGNTAYNAGEGDGHGIYVSNGSDWVIVRSNELFHNTSSDLQVNADPIYTCEEHGVAFDERACWGKAENGRGQGVSEYIWVEGNFLHDGYAQGPNFTSVRNSVVRHNVFGPYARHGVSFWQETEVVALGSSNNMILNNLFVGASNGDHTLQLIEHADNNAVLNNVFLGVDMSSGLADEDVLLIEVDDTLKGPSFHDNIYLGGHVDQAPSDFDDRRSTTVSPDWFADFPHDNLGTLSGWTPTSEAPFDLLDGWTPPLHP